MNFTRVVSNHHEQLPCFFLPFAVEDIILKNSTVPYKGALQIIMDRQVTSVCLQYLNKYTVNSICQQLGYKKAYSAVGVPYPVDAEVTTISFLTCHGPNDYLLWCGTYLVSKKDCAELTYIECEYSAILLYCMLVSCDFLHKPRVLILILSIY